MGNKYAKLDLILLRPWRPVPVRSSLWEKKVKYLEWLYTIVGSILKPHTAFVCSTSCFHWRNTSTVWRNRPTMSATRVAVHCTCLCELNIEILNVKKWHHERDRIKIHDCNFKWILWGHWSEFLFDYFKRI